MRNPMYHSQHGGPRASFPLALAAVATREQDSARVVGRVYAANTVGAIAGALGFSLLVIPLAGTRWAQQFLAGISAAAAFLIFVPLVWRCRYGREGTRVISGFGFRVSGFRASTMAVPASIIALLILGILLIRSISTVPWGTVAYGRFMATYGNRLSPGIVEEKDVPSGGGTPDIFCTYVGEGLHGTAAAEGAYDAVLFGPIGPTQIDLDNLQA